MTGEVRFVRAADGVGVRVARWSRPAPVARVLWMQGRGDFLELRERPASAWVARGVEVVSWDWRGQGGSERARGVPLGFGHVDDWASYRADLAAAASAWPSPGPTFVVAHSMGALVALDALLAQALPVDAVVLTSPMLGFPGPPPLGVTRALAEAQVALGRGKRPAWGERWTPPAEWAFDGNMSTHDRAGFAALRQGAMAHPERCVTGSTWGWVRAATAAFARLRSGDVGAIRVPLLFALAGQDRSVDNAVTEAFARRLPSARLARFDAAHDLAFAAPPIREALDIAILGFLTESGIPLASGYAWGTGAS